MLSALVVTFVFVQVLINFRPSSELSSNLESFPLEIDDWVGVRESIPDFVMTQLNPKDIFAADYVNSRGNQVNLFVDYFSGDDGGGPHSPRNCMPGSGWVILDSSEREITVGERTITAVRFDLAIGDTRKVMDFWYVTSYGETSNDYMFKFYLMLSSLALQATDVAFVRFFADGDPSSLAALDRFQQSVVSKIYERIPF